MSCSENRPEVTVHVDCAVMQGPADSAKDFCVLDAERPMSCPENLPLRGCTCFVTISYLVC